MVDKPVIVACIPAFNEERTIGGVVVRAMRYVDRVVICDDGSGDLTGVIARGWRRRCGMSGTGCMARFEACVG